MAYYVNTEERPLAQPREIQPSARLSFAGAVGSAVTGNLSSLGVDFAELQQANQGRRLPKAQADAAFSAAGIKHASPEDGYTQEAIDIIVKRKTDEATRRRIDDATPWSWVGSPVRGGAALLAGLTDPLNVASAFIPVVREARVASMLAKSSGGLAMAGNRAVVGAAEGLAGAALIEAPVVGFRTALQDDYTLTDSLLNLAFGTVAGGGLHAVGGAVGDALSGGRNPYARFAGLKVNEIRQVLDYETGRLSDISGFTSAQRRAAGLAEPRIAGQTDTTIAAVEESITADPARVRDAVQSELATLRDAPFAKLYEMTPEGAQRRALDAMRNDLRAELLADASGRAEPRVIAGLKKEQAELAGRKQAISTTEEFKARAKDFQRQGMSRKEAEAAARKSIADELADLTANEGRITATIEANARASQAEQDIARLDDGEVPERFAERVKAEADKFAGASEMARAITGNVDPPAAFVIGMASPETREAAMRTALADMANGRLPDVEALIRLDPAVIGPKATAQDVAQAAARQRDPDSAYLGDPAAADAAQVRAKDSPKLSGERGAADELAEAEAQLERLLRNIQGGQSAAAATTDPRLQGLADLREFDDAIKRAEAIGRAIEAGALCGVRQ